MATRTDWLDAGLSTLATQGAPALTIDRLAGEMGLSKGSFYHHFRGMPGFKAALLDHYESAFTSRYIDAVEGGATQAPAEKLRRLLGLILDGHQEHESELEIAVRAWALQDPQVRDALERVDATRMAYLRDVWFDLTGDALESHRMGRLLYVVLVGAEQVVPPVAPDDLRAIYDLLLRLALPV